MFGYVRIDGGELKVRELEQYRGIYCGLCRQLRKRYGFWASMTLNYDFAFLAMLWMTQEECPGFTRGRCTFQPLKRCHYCADEEALPAAADAAMLLVYYKLQDTLADSGFFKRLGVRLMMPVARRARRKALTRLDGADERMAAYMAKQAALEKRGETQLDVAAEPSAELLAYLAARCARDETERRVLERLGYCLGRWVYLIDAADDLDEDTKAERYNPFAGRSKEEILPALNASLAECIDAYDLLPTRRFDGILRNVLEYGMPQVQRQAVTGGVPKLKPHRLKKAGKEILPEKKETTHE